MEKMPFRDAQEVIDVHAAIASAQRVTTNDWRQALPVLTGTMATLRELRLADAPALLATLSTEEVSRFISPPPTTVEGFERFIAWTHRERAAGNYICFAVVPHNMDTAIGIFQVRQLEPGFGTAEWGFALASEGEGTKVTWGMDGNHNYVSKVMCVFMDMDKMIGTDFEKGLGQLKTLAESAPAAADPTGAGASTAGK